MAGLSVTMQSGAVLASLQTLGERTQTRVDKVTRRATYDLQRTIRGNASGRPGPRVRTGDYRRSWRVNFVTERSTLGLPRLVGEVSTNRPQARRLEHGFVGVDALGRLYNQPAFPHVAPAVRDVGATFEADVRAAVLGMKL